MGKNLAMPEEHQLTFLCCFLLITIFITVHVKPLLYGKYYLVDTNECYGTAHGCQHNCINTHGSYHCTCISGYTLSSNLKSCLGVYDIKKKDLIGMH